MKWQIISIIITLHRIIDICRIGIQTNDLPIVSRLDVDPYPKEDFKSVIILHMNFEWYTVYVLLFL